MTRNLYLAGAGWLAAAVLLGLFIWKATDDGGGGTSATPAQIVNPPAGALAQPTIRAQGDPPAEKDKPPPDQKPPKFTDRPQAAACDASAPANVLAEWAFQPSSFSDVKKRAKKAVEVQVVSVKAGDDIVISAAEEPGGEVRIPTQEVTVNVMKSAGKGQSKKGETMTLFKTGSACQRVDHDPAYVPGETELLLLDDGPKGMSIPVAPEGRYKIKADRTLQPVVDNAVTAEVKGKKADDVEKNIAGG
jgi:hypothetical protein